MNDQTPTVSDITAVADITPAPTQELATEIASTDTNKGLGDLNLEVKEGEKKGLLAIIIAILSDPQKFFASLFGKETKDEESENKSKWEELADSTMFAFFEEIKERFSLTQANTNPEDFNEKFEDSDFIKIIKSQVLKGIYSPGSLAILWSNKDNLKVKDGKLVIEKKTGEFQEIDTKNDKTIAKSIIPKESVSDRIPAFVKNLEASFTKNFSDIPQEYKSKIPTTMKHFETKLQDSVAEGGVPKFEKERILHSIESTISLNGFTRSMVDKKVHEFLASTDGIALKAEYKELWKA